MKISEIKKAIRAVVLEAVNATDVKYQIELSLQDGLGINSKALKKVKKKGKGYELHMSSYMNDTGVDALLKHVNKSLSTKLKRTAPGVKTGGGMRHTISESISEGKIKRGTKITYIKQFAFGKEGKETAKVVAIKGDKVLLDNGEELNAIDIAMNKKKYKLESITEAIKYKKGKTYQKGKDWTVYMSSGQAHFDIRVNNSAGWSTDPHDIKGETFRLLDAGKQRATIRFKEGNINKVAKQMHDLNSETTWGERNGLTSKDYADIIRVWISMGMEMNESSLGGQIAGDSAESLKDELKQYVKGIIKQPNDKVTYLHLKSASAGKKVVALLKKVYGIQSKVDTHMFSPSPTVKFDNDQMLESVNEGNPTANKLKHFGFTKVSDTLFKKGNNTIEIGGGKPGFLLTVDGKPQTDSSPFYRKYKRMDMNLLRGQLKKLKESVNEAARVDSSRYKRSHGKDPKGYGMWLFSFDEKGDDAFDVGSAMNYTAAKKLAAKKAKEAGKSHVYVMESIQGNKKKYKLESVNEATWDVSNERFKVTLTDGSEIDVKLKEGTGEDGVYRAIAKEIAAGRVSNTIKIKTIEAKASRPTLNDVEEGSLPTKFKDLYSDIDINNQGVDIEFAKNHGLYQGAGSVSPAYAVKPSTMGTDDDELIDMDAVGGEGELEDHEDAVEKTLPKK